MKTRNILFAGLMVGLAPDLYAQEKPTTEVRAPQARRIQVSSERSLKDVLFPDYSLDEKERKKSKNS